MCVKRGINEVCTSITSRFNSVAPSPSSSRAAACLVISADYKGDLAEKRWATEAALRQSGNAESLIDTLLDGGTRLLQGDSTGATRVIKEAQLDANSPPYLCMALNYA